MGGQWFVAVSPSARTPSRTLVEKFVYEVGDGLFDEFLAKPFSQPELDAVGTGGDGGDDDQPGPPGDEAKSAASVTSLVDQLRLEQLEFFLKEGCVYSHPRLGHFLDDLRFFKLWALFRRR